METVFYALLSVLFRSSNSVFDRLSYGLRKQSILVLNFINNFTPFVLLTLLLMVQGRLGDVWPIIGNGRLALFALSIQGVAFAFSYGFRHLPIVKVNIASRLGDVLIPLSLMLCGRAVHWSEYLFAIAVSACSLMATGSGGLPQQAMWVPGLLITSAVIVQSVCGELFFQAESAATLASLEVSTIIMFWRSAFCLALTALVMRSHLRGSLQWVHDGRAWLNLGLRSVFTVGTQITFVLALAGGNRVIAWPILNSVTLFSMVFAGAFINEHPERREVFAVMAVVLLALIKALA